MLKSLSGKSTDLSSTGNDNFKKTAVNVKIADIDARLNNTNYLSSSEINNSQPWYWYTDGGQAANGIYKTHSAWVRAVFAF